MTKRRPKTVWRVGKWLALLSFGFLILNFLGLFSWFAVIMLIIAYIPGYFLLFGISDFHSQTDETRRRLESRQRKRRRSH